MVTPNTVIPEHVMLTAIGNSLGLYTRLASLLETSIADAKRRVQAEAKYKRAMKKAAELRDDYVVSQMIARIGDGDVKAMDTYIRYLQMQREQGMEDDTKPITLVQVLQGPNKADTSPPRR